MVSIFDVPKPIRLWFSSDEVANELDKMNGWLGIAKENATLIADLLAGLELKDVTIDAFNERLKNRLIPLVGEEKTRLAIQDVDEKILKPIKNDLIGFGIFPVETSYRPAAGSEAPVAVPSGTAAETPAPAEARPESSLKPAFETEPEPFLLHKAAETHPEQPAEEKKPAASEPVPAEPSMPLISPKFQETNSKQTPEPGVRVVNYSEFKTEVEPGSQVSKEPTNINPQNTLDLRKTDQTSKPETTKNTINLKDLPVE